MGDSEDAPVEDAGDATTEDDRSETPLSSDEYRAIYHSVNDAIFVHDAETGEILDVNETMCEMYSYTREQARELRVEDLSSGNPPFTQDNAIEYLQRAAEGDPQLFEWRAKDSEGRLFWVEVSMRRAVVDGDERILTVVRDVDEEKRTQEREAFLHSLLRHDLANKVQVITGNLEAVERYEVADEARDLVDRALGAARESADLIGKVRTLRAVDRDANRALQSVDAILREVVDTYESRAADAGMDLNYEPIGGQIRCGPLLNRLFSNLVENAIVHSGGSRIRIDGEFDGDICRVSVADDGRGIPEDEREQIMERGVTKGDTGGTGLGLALATKIAQNHGGTIEITDADLGGACFEVTLSKYPPEEDD